MGSPLGPTLANIFLCHHENIWLQDCPPHFRPFLYRRYMDDTLTFFHHRDHIDQFLTYLNSRHTNIKFTVEHAINNCIPFLDMNINICNNKFSTSIYRKPTFTGLSTNYNSFIYSKFKINAINTLIHRAYHLSSSFFNFNSEISFLSKFFSDNGYPPYIIDKKIKTFLNAIYSPIVRSTTVEKKKLYIPLPFYGRHSETDYNNLMKNLSSIFPQLHLIPVLTTSKTLSSFFPSKDRLPSELCSSVIYKYKCGGCNSSYIGSTVRRAVDRFSEHLSISPRTGRIINTSFSHIRNHAHELNHPLSIKNFSILDSAPPHNLRTYESLHILFYKPDINVQNTATELFVTPPPPPPPSPADG